MLAFLRRFLVGPYINVMTEKQNIIVQLEVAQKSFNLAVELQDFESAHILSSKLQLLTRQLCLLEKQTAEEKA